jgi:hypothetical protein
VFGVRRGSRVSADVFVEPLDWDLRMKAEEVVAVESSVGALNPVLFFSATGIAS